MNKKDFKERIKLLEENKKAIEKEIVKLKFLSGEMKENEADKFMCNLFDNFYKKPTRIKFNEYIEFNNICMKNGFDSSEDYIIKEMEEIL